MAISLKKGAYVSMQCPLYSVHLLSTMTVVLIVHNNTQQVSRVQVSMTSIRQLMKFEKIECRVFSFIIFNYCRK